MEGKVTMEGLKNSALTYGAVNPFKAFALVSFSVLGAIPVLVFVAYFVATLVAVVIGSVVVELFLLGVGITCLAFVLFFVTCITLCISSMFGALYFSYKVASSTLSSGIRFRLSRRIFPSQSTSSSHSGEEREGVSEVDKMK